MKPPLFAGLSAVLHSTATSRRPWLPALGLGAGGWLATDLLLRLSHLPLSSAVTISGLLAGAWWLRRPRPSGPAAADVPGWLKRLERLERQFTALDRACPGRAAELDALRLELEREPLVLALVGTAPPDPSLQPELAAALRSPEPLELLWANPLPAWSAGWCWPAPFAACDGLIHHLRMPLGAADLRWLEALPAGQPVWLLVESAGQGPARDLLAAELAAQLGEELSRRCLFWDGQRPALAASLAPLAQELSSSGPVLRQARQLRRLQHLHGQWQRQLEQLRRQQLQPLVRRTQWIVAAGVVAAPLPSVDLLVLAVANGLMLQEMARLWDCPWAPEQLQAAAVELAKVSLALGVVEWSTQTLAGLAKWHGATWLVGGAIQALSAAYLTRVVARAMADMLALSVGVAEPDLAAIKRQAPALVAQAADAEKLDWPAFLEQARQWWRQSAAAGVAEQGGTALA